MSCPAWDKCSKIDCKQKGRCCNPEYWSGLSDKAMKEYKKMIERMASGDPCTKDKNGKCDKRKTCEFLTQCVFSLPAVKDNPRIIKSLSGKKSMKQVLDVLAKHNPKPMRSYYFDQREKKKK